MIVTADTHLTSHPDEGYRWAVFDSIRELLSRDRHLLILGDLTDRRDKHDSTLVNRLVDTFTDLVKQYGAEVTIVMGNHDRSLYSEKPYWAALNAVPKVRFVYKPTAHQDQLLLPYTAHPKEEWQGIDLKLYRVAFCHLTMKQLMTGIGFPRMLKIYSGDEHTPQTIRGVTYVGAPHPVKFGDEHKCRLLILDDTTYEITSEIPLTPVRKHILEIGSAGELMDARVHKNDMARVRLVLPVDRMGEWKQEQTAIVQWARLRGVSLDSIEPVIETDVHQETEANELSDPVEIMAAFGDAEGLDDGLLATGLDLINEATGNEK